MAYQETRAAAFADGVLEILLPLEKIALFIRPRGRQKGQRFSVVRLRGQLLFQPVNRPVVARVYNCVFGVGYYLRKLIRSGSSHIIANLKRQQPERQNNYLSQTQSCPTCKLLKAAVL
jgi:hypothetical protein